LVKHGWRVGFDRVNRLWKQEHKQVPRKQRKRKRIQSSGASNNTCMHYKPTHRNHVWSYDFVNERTQDDRQLKLLVVTCPPVLRPSLLLSKFNFSACVARHEARKCNRHRPDDSSHDYPPGLEELLPRLMDQVEGLRNMTIYEGIKKELPDKEIR